MAKWKASFQTLRVKLLSNKTHSVFWHCQSLSLYFLNETTVAIVKTFRENIAELGHQPQTYQNTYADNAGRWMVKSGGRSTPAIKFHIWREFVDQ